MARLETHIRLRLSAKTPWRDGRDWRDHCGWGVVQTSDGRGGQIRAGMCTYHLMWIDDEAADGDA